MNIAYICCFIQEEIVSREINILYEKMIITLYIKEECLNLIDSYYPKHANEIHKVGSLY